MRSKAWIALCMILLIGLCSCSEMKLQTIQEEGKENLGRVQGRLTYRLALDSYELGQFDNARKFAEEAIGYDSTTPEPYILLAKLLLEKGETASASHALDQAINHGGNNAELYYLSGVIAQRYRRHAEALGWYEGACERDPMSAHYVAAAAETLVALDRPAEALRLVNDRLTDYENNATLRALAGGIYMMLGQYEEAANAYQEALRISPDDTMLQYHLGMALAMMDHYQEAIPVLSSVADREDAPLHILVTLGRCYMKMDKPEDAKVLFQKAIKIDPQHAQSRSWLARAALVMGDLITARQAAIEAVRLKPDDPDYGILLGYICWQQKDYASAVAVLQQIIDKHADDVSALYILAKSYESLGNKKAAQECYLNALRINPDCEWANQYFNKGSAQKEDRPRTLVQGNVMR